MSLRDAACYSLTLVPSLQNPKVLELVENYNGPSDGPRAQISRFARVKETKEGEVYSAAIHDYLSGAKLASVGQETIKAKSRRLQLHGPDEDVSFEFTGKISFEWTFTFEGNKYRWNRSGSEYICAIDRKPDPKVEICLAREADKKEPARLQILHYNIDRFPNEIKDLRGLETLLVTTFMSFLDDMDTRRERTSVSPVPPVIVAGSASDAPPEPPTKPQKIISDEDFEPENPNEIMVSMTSPVDEHVSRAIWLLEDPHVLFIVIRTRVVEATQRALDVSLGVTRFRHKEGLDELKQYVIEEEPVKPDLKLTSPTLGRGAPQPIKLDDPTPKSDRLTKPSPSGPSTSGSIKKAKSTNWSAPNIAIYMSKIDLPDLAPGRRGLQKAKSNAEMGKGQKAQAPAPNLAHLPPPPTGSSASHLPPPPSNAPPPPARPGSSPGHESTGKPSKTEGKKDSSWRNMMKAASGSR